MMRISTQLTDAAARLEDVSDSSRLDAELLLAYVLRQSRTWLFVHAGDTLSATEADAYAALIARRMDNEPVAYILGRKEFWSVPLTVTPATLVPRPETERLVEIALQHIPEREHCRVADLGTGSGAVAIAIALERPLAEIIACDISRDALAIAAQNALSLNLDNIRFVESNWTDELHGLPFDTVVSNPPYVEAEHPALARLGKEPLSALVSGPDGLDALRHLATAVKGILKINGCFACEHGAEQAESLNNILARDGWKEIHHFKDYAGKQRVTSAIFRG